MLQSSCAAVLIEWWYSTLFSDSGQRWLKMYRDQKEIFVFTFSFTSQREIVFLWPFRAFIVKSAFDVYSCGNFNRARSRDVYHVCLVELNPSVTTAGVIRVLVRRVCVNNLCL